MKFLCRVLAGELRPQATECRSRLFVIVLAVLVTVIRRKARLARAYRGVKRLVAYFAGASAATGFLSVPRPEISTSHVSPGFICTMPAT